MKKKKRLILIIIALVVLVVAASYTVFIAPMLEKKDPKFTQTEVMTGDLVIGITESGYLEYKVHTIDYDLDLTSILLEDDDQEDSEDTTEETVRYLEIEEVYIAQGQKMTEGDALLKFSESSVTSVKKMLQSALADAKVDYNEAESEYRLGVLEAENTLELSRSAAKYAKEIYAASDSSIDNEITVLQMEIARAREQAAELEEAVSESYEEYQESKPAYEEALELYNATGVENFANYQQVKNVYEQAKSAFDRAQSSWEQAVKKQEENAETIVSYTEELAILQARKSIDKLEAAQEYEENILSGANAEYSYESTIESLKEELKEAEKEKTALEQKLADFEALVGEDGILYAPASGKISQVTYEAGDTLERTGTLFEYILEDGMTVSVDVTQEDIVALSVGDTVDIEFIAYQGELFSGTIYSIDTTATSTDTPTISYTVVIRVDGSIDKLFGGMSADITFVTERIENTLYISRKAIEEENGKTYVWVDGGLGTKEMREVTTGKRNENYIEILSGLTKEDKVYTVDYL